MNFLSLGNDILRMVVDYSCICTLRSLLIVLGNDKRFHKIIKIINKRIQERDREDRLIDLIMTLATHRSDHYQPLREYVYEIIDGQENKIVYEMRNSINLYRLYKKMLDNHQDRLDDSHEQKYGYNEWVLPTEYIKAVIKRQDSYHINASEFLSLISTDISLFDLFIQKVDIRAVRRIINGRYSHNRYKAYVYHKIDHYLDNNYIE